MTNSIARFGRRYLPNNHALLSASSASRWLKCPASAYHTMLAPQVETPYAKEGTLAHNLAENLLRAKLEDDTEQLKIWRDEADKKHLRFVDVYVDYCWSIYTQLNLSQGIALMAIEDRLDLSKYVPEGFGTSDCVIVSDNELHIIDLKYGMGVPVDAKNNIQLQLYALGAYEKYSALYDINMLHMHIVQPRLRNITTQVMTVDALKNWANLEVINQAKLAYEQTSLDYTKERTYRPQEVTCRFCPIKAECKARAVYVLEGFKNLIGGF